MIYLLRHGETDAAGRGCFIGQIDIPLNDKGREQARRWHKKLSHINLDRIYSSDLGRCRETAQLIAGKKDVYFLEILREINLGDWEGLFHDDVKAKFPAEWSERGTNLLYRPPGGESFDDLNKRVIPVFDEIAALDLQNILIITHAGVIRVIISHILKISAERIFSITPDYAGMNIINNKKIPFQLVALNLKI